MKKTVLLTIFLCLLLNQGLSQQTEFAKSSDGINIAYQVYGNGKIPLVFVHGWCCDKSYWKEQTSILKNKYKRHNEDWFRTIKFDAGERITI